MDRTKDTARLVAQMQKDGYTPAQMAWVLKGTSIKTACGYGNAVGVAKVANALLFRKTAK